VFFAKSKSPGRDGYGGVRVLALRVALLSDRAGCGLLRGALREWTMGRILCVWRRDRGWDGAVLKRGKGWDFIEYDCHDEVLEV